jgi:hypothetical protein
MAGSLRLQVNLKSNVRAIADQRGGLATGQRGVALVCGTLYMVGDIRRISGALAGAHARAWEIFAAMDAISGRDVPHSVGISAAQRHASRLLG